MFGVAEACAVCVVGVVGVADVVVAVDVFVLPSSPSTSASMLLVWVVRLLMFMMLL